MLVVLSFLSAHSVPMLNFVQMQVRVCWKKTFLHYFLIKYVCCCMSLKSWKHCSTHYNDKMCFSIIVWQIVTLIMKVNKDKKNAVALHIKKKIIIIIMKTQTQYLFSLFQRLFTTADTTDTQKNFSILREPWDCLAGKMSTESGCVLIILTENKTKHKLKILCLD